MLSVWTRIYTTDVKYGVDNLKYMMLSDDIESDVATDESIWEFRYYLGMMNCISTSHQENLTANKAENWLKHLQHGTNCGYFCVLWTGS